MLVPFLIWGTVYNTMLMHQLASQLHYWTYRNCNCKNYWTLSLFTILIFMDILQLWYTYYTPQVLSPWRRWRTTKAYEVTDTSPVDGFSTLPERAIHSSSDGVIVLVLGQVRHSFHAHMSPPLQCWVLIHQSRLILAAHCTYTAGLTETCSHIGAILHWVETAVQMRDDTTCIFVENKWIAPAPVLNILYLKSLIR